MSEKLEPTRRGWSISSLHVETGVERRTLRKWLAAVKPIGKENGHELYALADLIAVIRGKGDDAVGKRQAEAAARQGEADADNAEIKRDESMKKLLDASMVESAWEEIISPAKQKFQALPSKLRSSAGLSEKQAEKLEREIADICEELSKVPNYKVRTKDETES